VIPILTPAEMKAVDADAPEPVEELIDRAGAAVARAAIDLLGGTYGRRIVVIAGPGNNGADGRVAAARLRARGARVEVVEPGVASLPRCDLVVDAAYGTGFHGTWSPPVLEGDPLVLAVDIPSGVDGLTGAADGDVLRADRTVTFAALKPGLLFADVGAVELVDIGLDVSHARAHLVTDDDVRAWLPERAVDAHKYAAAVWVVAGSPDMRGAPKLAASAVLRAGSGYVRVSTPGAPPVDLPTEAVHWPVPMSGWSEDVLADLERFKAVAVGPGLGRAPDVGAEVAALLRDCPLPIVVDADALTTLDVPPHAVLTPHDGEYERLLGQRPGADRFEAARGLAAKAGATALLKDCEQEGNAEGEQQQDDAEGEGYLEIAASAFQDDRRREDAGPPLDVAADLHRRTDLRNGGAESGHHRREQQQV